MRLRCDLLLAAALITQVAFAQGPHWTAPIPAVQQPGLYSVVLGPELIGRSRTDLGDLRLVDSTGQDVPYVLRKTQGGPSKAGFVPYTLLRNEVQPKRTVIELERPGDRVLDEMHIWIRPVDVEKHVRILGSDDRKQWYMVKDEQVALQGARGDPPHQVLTIPIPRSDYRYFQLLLNDSLTAPMRVLGVGRFADDVALPRYTQSAPLQWDQQDTARTTRLHVRSGHPIELDRIRFGVSDTVPFRRTGQLRAIRTVAVRKGRRDVTTHTEETLATFVIGSDLAPMIDVHGAREDNFDLVIDNGDDRPLHFTTIEAFATEQVLLADLSPGMTYRLTTGDAYLQAPHYDKAHFMDERSTPLDTLAHGEITAIDHTSIEAKAFDPSAWWVWAFILLLMAGMGFMAFRMLKKVDQ